MKCYDCPVRCGADREKGVGACKAPKEFKIAHADLHFWEEPCISGKGGTGAVFFSGCNLNCVFCQNFKISGTGGGKVVSEEELTDIILALIERGAQTVSFVTPSHYITRLSEFLASIKPKLNGIPIVYNSSGYDSVEGLKKLDGLVDVYLPDYKYGDSDLAKKYGARADYPSVAFAAVKEMISQQPNTVFDGDGVIRKGVIVRHLVLPGCIENTKLALDVIRDLGRDVYVSLMAQYFPVNKSIEFDNLKRRLTQEEYDQAIDYFFDIGLKNGFSQELTAADEGFVPDFNFLK
ncbi:MAG: radical SAM protein [Eubacteriales bacterium]|nr:radical SAM protein [Eubacteriales bacterium]